MGGLFFKKWCEDRAAPREFDRSPAEYKLLLEVWLRDHKSLSRS